ncbi:hypothetical protein AVEN_144272-1 [Araneus ventricosus]|uniref:Tc1-like transposase DDE domain-containing protein n=1 Tax=Araneus ventricosus TaxID=182803 RepID=A0A4Y2H9R5_ARAVE|nr:hypothetical protein AVEN_144272-1 [Araneus ventricosus]
MYVEAQRNLAIGPLGLVDRSLHWNFDCNGWYPGHGSFIQVLLRKAWFQHDGAPAHKSSSVKQYMVKEFGEQITGYDVFQEWPPHSPDLIPVDFFLWG